MIEIKYMTVVIHEDKEFLCFIAEYKYSSEVKFIPIGTANKGLIQAFYDTLYGDDNE